MGSTTPSIAILPSQRQCAICLRPFGEMTDAQWRINARFHYLSVRHQRAIQVRRLSVIPNDPSVVRYQILRLALSKKSSDGTTSLHAADLSTALRVPVTAIQRQLEVLEHCELLKVHADATDGAICVRPEAEAVVRAADRDLTQANAASESLS